MDQISDRIQGLLALVSQRSEMFEKFTNTMAQLISPCLSTIQRMSGVDDACFKVVDIQADDTVLTITMRLTYDPNADLTPFLRVLHEQTPEPTTSTEVTRALSLGIPILIALGDQETLEKWILNITQATYNSALDLPPLVDIAPQITEDAKFDGTDLTIEQIHQLLFFQQHTKTVKQ